LAGAIRAEEAEDLALIDGEVDAVDCFYFTEMTNEVFGDDGCAVHLNSLAE
ncbi:MAG: hypothetical protein RI908_214, partial [Actinomycetota bacterium]